MKVEPIKPAKIVILDREHTFPFRPSVFGWIQTGGEEIEMPEPAVKLNYLMKAPGMAKIK